MDQTSSTHINSSKLTILGGQCNDDQVSQLLTDWLAQAQMPYRIWEYTHSIAFEQNTLPEDVQWLERARLFGPGGDLSLRRNGSQFLWSFIGPFGITLPDWKPQPFFAGEQAETVFAVNQKKALLWGNNSPDPTVNLFWDDRVAGAALTYPVSPGAERVAIEYEAYSRAGKVEFVWFKGLQVIKKGGKK